MMMPVRMEEKLTEHWLELSGDSIVNFYIFVIQFHVCSKENEKLSLSYS